MIRLDVWLTLPSGQGIKAGALVVGDPDPVNGGLQGQFRYAAAYLDNPQAFALDPLQWKSSKKFTGRYHNGPKSSVNAMCRKRMPKAWARISSEG
jgi:hypothetical protein